MGWLTDYSQGLVNAQNGANANAGAFDSAAYLAANPDVAAAGMDAFQHYQQYGQNEGRQGFFQQTPYEKLSSSASSNGWSPDVGDWFNGKQQTYNAATDGQVGAPIERSRFNDFLDAHQINQDERDDYYNNYLNQFSTAQQEQQQYQADPRGYTNQKATDLSNQLFTSFTNNGHGFGGTSTHEAENTAQLDAIKKVDPGAYYSAMLHLDMQKAGWDAGQGKTNADTNARIQNNIQEALKVGISPEQINNYVKYDYGVTAEGHAKNIAQRQGQGAFLQGIEKVAPAFAAMITAGALAPAAAAMEAGAVGAGAAGEIAGGSLYTGAGTFGGEGLGTAAELMGPTYGELGVTGLPEGAMGPTYGEMGYTGLNQGQAIAGANAASQGSQALDALNYANKARNLIGTGNNLAKLLSGATSTASGSNATSGLSQQQLAQYLKGAAPAQASAVPYQIKMNQNPYIFDVPGQTKATEGMYDVSGMNPMANALRKA
jgi:hypothetical protein